MTSPLIYSPSLDTFQNPDGEGERAMKQFSTPGPVPLVLDLVLRVLDLDLALHLVLAQDASWT